MTNEAADRLFATMSLIRAFEERVLEAPVLRVGAPFAPVPTSAALEDLYLPGKDEIVAAVRAALRW